MGEKDLVLFGGTRSWKADDWTASDDRVRGGKSQSYFDCSKDVGRFNGELDIKTLGGAGFASQRTTGEDRTWNLSDYAGILLDIAEADAKKYTFILKDNLLDRNPDNGREQATISWEYDFEMLQTIGAREKAKTESVFIPWSNLKPTYRGKENHDADPLDLKSIKRMSIMMRSFFGTQEGPFSLSLRSITATKRIPVGYHELESGTSSARRAHWRTWSRSFTLALSPWKICGVAFLITAICYSQGYIPRIFRQR
ncbi:complex I intermediate-associated protein 30-domain-containing protein [Delphinella strobiligena]|nr:complex I intermediate-associated protein 30-domain-containing protein [Delphinella strobiligena]